MLRKQAALVVFCSLCAMPALGGSSKDGPVLSEAAPIPGLDGGKPQPEHLPPGSSSAGGPDNKAALRALIREEATKAGVPQEIADAVAAIESNYDPLASGTVGEIGVMQVRPETAAMLGFAGSLAELAKPEVNIRYGMIYLGQAWRLAGGDLCRALMKYRAGHGQELISPLSAAYCARAQAYLSAEHSPYARGLPSPLASTPFLRAPLLKLGPPKNRTAAVSRAFWAAHEARVRAITQQIEAKWRRKALGANG